MPTILPYQPTWASEFLALAKIIRDSLGDLAQRIDHIGSTAVPGLAAKDIIDILVTVAQLAPAVEAAFNTVGFQRNTDIDHDHQPPGERLPAGSWSKWLFKPPADLRPVNVHVRLSGHPNQRYALLFRDYFRSHPATAQSYAELKLRLAQNLADPQTYPDMKDPAVDLIFFAAEDWVASTGWQPGPPDF
jgi:GrpB-like predicted nucleotidyltransferase (UPF0157 family)